ncbi:uncharacterized protein si:ch211-256a21.4 [Polypterus senegalus]|uniref:uncharacterized protein si:ch211-256a21.4 n=1 Tax=Polypterus senegalus TaxID=55291 RepID=UPI001966007E|nr:uncharacterized protein si:ch211-256a21.4 [Polypterus senegalus]
MNCWTATFRLAESLLGLVGCVCVVYAVWQPYWLGDEGLLIKAVNVTAAGADHSSYSGLTDFRALATEQIFAILSSFLALCSGCICLVVMCCMPSSWTTRSKVSHPLVHTHKVLHPGTLLMVILIPTGVFFFISWLIFTLHHRQDIASDITQLGSCYWFGLSAWVLLLLFFPMVYFTELYAGYKIADKMKYLLKDSLTLEDC